MSRLFSLSIICHRPIDHLINVVLTRHEVQAADNKTAKEVNQETGQEAAYTFEKG